MLVFFTRLSSYILALLLSVPAFTSDIEVQINTGILSGTLSTDGMVASYKGIPYAAPPVGERRWLPPVAPEKWSGTRDASQYGDACIQKQPPEGSFYQKEFLPIPIPTSENCLFLNVWTSTKGTTADRKPVMVWLFPGGFAWGSGSDPAIDGTALARKDVVLITINYRVGMLGFMAHPDLTEASPHKASGNYGLLDQIAALKWVQENINSFGGDPDNVTLFGLSAGAISTHLLTASPLAKGLFHKAIAQSGSVFSMSGHTTLANSEAIGVSYANSLGAKSIQDMRQLPVSELMKSPPRAWPNVDGWVLPESVYSTFKKGRQNDVPTLVGGTTREASTFPGGGIGVENFKVWANQQYGNHTDEYLKIYETHTDTDAWNNLIMTMTEWVHWAARKWASLQHKTGTAPVYLYSFDRSPPGRDSALYGAFHMSDIVYAFNNLDAVDRPWTETDRKLADLMSDAWVNFAKTGNPNGGALPDWPVYSAKSDLVMEFGEETKVTVGNRNMAAHAFLDKRLKENKAYLTIKP